MASLYPHVFALAAQLLEARCPGALFRPYAQQIKLLEMEENTTVKNDKGNYRGYYKMRPDSNSRLLSLNATWFRGMTCLDVGCNDGQFCLALAESFTPKFILGIDTDFVLIDSAQSKLKRLQYSKRTNAPIHTAEKPTVAVRKPPVVFGGFLPRTIAVKSAIKSANNVQEGSGQFVAIASSSRSQLPVAADADEELFPNNVKFKAKDIFDISTVISSSIEGKYDTVTCFSVTKWIHLNGGDAKLLEMFCKFYSLVRKGGRVIIEYQPWKSYLNNKTASETIKKVFPTIHIKPEYFEWVLTEVVGFEIEARLGPALADSKGFDRPILVLRRPAATGMAPVRVWDNHADFDVVCNSVCSRLPGSEIIQEILKTPVSAPLPCVASSNDRAVCSETSSEVVALQYIRDKTSDVTKRKHKGHHHERDNSKSARNA